MLLKMTKNKLDRAILDTNILLSKIINSEFENLIDTLISHNIEVYTCEEQLTELQNNLSKPKISKFFKRNTDEIVEMISDIFYNIQIDKRFDRANEKDNYLFDLAYSVKSYYIVTGDKPLLNIKRIGKIELISYNDWLKLLKA